MNENIKGVMATIATPIGVTVAWLPAIETGLRIGVSVVGIVAGICAARYWHKKSKLADAGKDTNKF